MSGLGIVLHHGIESGADLAEYGRLAEAAGLESLWVTERYFHEETFSLLGYLSAVTSRLKLAVGVVNPFTRSPAVVAMASATLDRLCGGRFMLGLGRSERPVIAGRIGINYRRSRATLRETVELVRALLAGETVSARVGDAVLADVRLAIKPVQGKLPIYLAAIGPKGLRLAGAVADGVLLNAYASLGYVRYAVQEVRTAAAEAGRDPRAVDIACMLVVRVTDGDRAGLMPGLKQRIVRLLAEPHVGEMLLEKGGFDPGILAPLRSSLAKEGPQGLTHLISDEIVEAFYVLGPPERCRSRIAEYRRAGVDRPLLLPRLADFRRVAETLAPGRRTS